MIVNRQALLKAAPIKNMYWKKERAHGVSFGLGEAGYDIRIAESITFVGPGHYHYVPVEDSLNPGRYGVVRQALKEQTVFRTTRLSDSPLDIKQEQFPGRFVIASAMEEFQMPDDLVGVVHDKSTWARKGLSVFNTVLEPGWKGFLTLELVYHGSDVLKIPAGAGIAQILFSRIEEQSSYDGKYQNQAAGPVEAIFEKG